MTVAIDPPATRAEVAAIVAVLDADRTEGPAPSRASSSAWRAAALREATAPFDRTGGTR